MTMRRVWMVCAVVVLGACGAAGEDQGAPAARAQAEAAAPRTTDREVRVNSVAMGDFQLVLHRRESGVVDSVFVMRAGRRVQALVPSELEEHSILDDPTYRVDLDWDGHLDFALVTLVPAAPNPAYDYWRFDPAAGRFHYVGNFGMLHPDSTTRTMSAHSRNGHAGRLWSNVQYQYIDGRLVEVWANQQTFFDDIQRYGYVIYERRGDSLAVVSVDTLDDSEVEPVWDEPQDEADPVVPPPDPLQATARIPALPRNAFTLFATGWSTVDSIVVAVDGRREQVLWPGRHLLLADTRLEERLSARDLDFDGHPDLALLSELAAGNSRSQYWRQDPRTGRFTVAGEYETMVPDPAARELTTFSRDGEGGRLWTAGRWRWAGDVLEPVVQESQAAMDDDSGRYLLAANRWSGTRWERVRLDTIRESRLRAGPSWMKP